MTTQPKPHWSPRQLANAAGRGVQTIYNRLQRYRRGEPRPRNFPRPIIVGNRVSFDADECERWLCEGDGPIETSATAEIGGAT